MHVYKFMYTYIPNDPPKGAVGLGAAELNGGGEQDAGGGGAVPVEPRESAHVLYVVLCWLLSLVVLCVLMGGKPAAGGQSDAITFNLLRDRKIANGQSKAGR